MSNSEECARCGNDDDPDQPLFAVADLGEEWCVTCVASEWEEKRLRLAAPLAPPDWHYVAYPWSTQSDVFRSSACRLVTDDMEALRAFRPAHCAALSYGYVRASDWRSLERCWNDTLVRSLRRGGPDGEGDFGEPFLRAVWRDWPEARFALHVPRAPRARVIAVDRFDCEQDFIDDVVEYVGRAPFWYPARVSRCDIAPPAELYRWYASPSECITWCGGGTVDELERARWDPLMREPDEVTFTSQTDGGGK